MQISKHAIRIAAVTGGCCLAATGHADVFTPKFPVTERHAAEAANTAGSYAAVTMMGAQGYSNAAIPSNWDSMITSSCAAETTKLGGTLWPGGCNPDGMANAVAGFTANDWETFTWPATSEADALTETLISLQTFGSPALVPIYGQADHWVAITQITATNTGGVWTINQVKAYDGGPPGQTDSGFTNYNAGLQIWGGSSWANVYFKVLTAINPSCDPSCTSDPYYGKYVLTFEPPRGAPHPHPLTAFSRAPGVVSDGMTAAAAERHVWRALSAAGIDGDPAAWSAIRGGVAGRAYEVNAVWPNGSRWDYFLVPIVSRTGSALAFVQLAADDGAFEGIHVFDHPIAFAPITERTATRLAERQLAGGESLTAGILTWDPKGSAKVQKSPFSPYYEFGVITRTGTAGTVRVPLGGGAPVRGQ